MSFKSVFLLFAGTTFLVSGQSAIDAPRSGVIYDPLSSAIRPILGVPGAAYLGPALVSDIETALIAPNSKAAVACRGGVLSSIIDLRADVSVRDLGTCEEKLQFAWTSDSQTAVAYDGKGGLRWIDFSGDPAAGDPVAVPAGLNVRKMAAVAHMVLIVGDDEAGPGLFRIQNDGTFDRVSGGGFSDIAAAGPELAYAIETVEQRVASIRISDGAVELATIAYLDPESHTASLVATADGKRILLADPEAGLVRSLEIATASIDLETDVPVRPTGLAAIPGSRLFAVNADRSNEEPLWVIDARGATLVAYFIP